MITLPTASETRRSTKPSEWIHRKRTKASISEAAREIREHLDKWYAQKDVAKAKWAWELMQNARDVAKELDKERLDVTFSLDGNRLIFSHNAGPFSLDDIYALINGRSSKPLETPGIIGQFGKGFIVTHIVSGKVQVKGWLEDDSIGIRKTFEIPLDRSIQANDELTVTDIAKNIEECSIQLDSPGPSLAHNLTQFEYPLSNEGRKAAIAGLGALEKALPFVLAFTEPKMTVTIVRDDCTSVYKITETKLIQSEPVRIELLKMAHQEKFHGDGLIVASLGDSDVKITLPYSSKDHTILDLRDTPRLFKMYPLAKTEDLPLPVVINAPFRVSAERFDLQYRDDQIEELEDILQIATNLLKELYEWSLGNHIPHMELLLRVKAPSKERPYNVQWAQALASFATDISQLKAVATLVNEQENKTEFLKPDEVYFPSPLVGLSSFEDEKFILGIWYLSLLLGQKVPAKKLIKEWNLIRDGWKTLDVTAGNEQTFESLVVQTDELESLANLEEKVGLAKKASAFLKGLYQLGDYYRRKRVQIPEFLDMAIYCNQDGDFKSPEELSIDQNVPDALKKISDEILEPLSECLLDTRFSRDEKLRQHFQTLGLNTINEKKAIGLLYDSIHRNWKQRAAEMNADKYKRGVMEFGKWILQKKNMEPLLKKEYPLSELPFLCEDNKLRIAKEDRFMLPEAFLEKATREHMKIWPNDVKLSTGYAKGISNLNLVKSRLVSAGISWSDFVFNEEIELSPDQIKDLCKKQIRGTFEAIAKVSKILAFNRVLEFAEKSRNPNLTKAILVFLLRYAVQRDNSWQELKSIQAAEVGPNVYGQLVPTGRRRDIQICPSLWLAQMKRNKWVVTTSMDEKGNKTFDVDQPSKDNLTEFLKPLSASILGNEKVLMFLHQKFEFAPIEITGWLLTGGKAEVEQALVDSLKQIHEIANSQGLSAVHLLNEMLLEKARKELFTKRNMNFGLLIERAVRKVFEQQLKYGKYDFEVIPRWKGYDFEAYLRKQIEEFDYGTLSITVQKARESKEILARFEVEVKATRRNTVAMTLTQANNAVDHAEEYLLCVVDVKEASEDFADLGSVSLGDDQIEKLSERILPLMNIVNIGEDLKQVVLNIREASSPTQDIKVDYSARFIIPSKLWKTKGKTVSKWFISVLQELEVSVSQRNSNK